MKQEINELAIESVWLWPQHNKRLAQLKFVILLSANWSENCSIIHETVHKPCFQRLYIVLLDLGDICAWMRERESWKWIKKVLNF